MLPVVVATLASLGHRDSMVTHTTAGRVMDSVEVLYNNDGENLWAVQSPYHDRATAVTESDIRGSVNDVAGVADVDLICPFHNVPWWDSKLEPPSAHRNWYDSTFNFTWGSGGSQLDFVLKGGDFIGVFANQSKQTGQIPFVAFRLNDGQMCSHPPVPDNDTSPINNDHQFDRMSQFWWEHRSNKSVILGLQQSTPVGWQPCCWGWGGRNCSCPTSGCELSWLSSAVRNRIAALVGEVAQLYAARGLGGIELDFQRGLDYFPPNTPTSTRRAIMHDFLRGIRVQMDAVSTALGVDQMALGLRLTPTWSVLQFQGLDEIATLVAPVAKGGDGITYLNWAIFFYAIQPFDTEFASVVAATPTGTPYFYEVSSWVGTGPQVASCSRGPKVRITKEELYTTALIARAYGAHGVSAFNFIYTRPFYDFPCEFEINMPYSEPLFGALGATKNETFLHCCADQFYRLSPTSDPGYNGQIPAGGLVVGGTSPKSLHLFATPPTGGWQKVGQLRLLTKVPIHPNDLRVELNGHVLSPRSNSSSLYGDGSQAKLALWNASLWAAWDVPSTAPKLGNNTVTVSLQNASAAAFISPPMVPRGPLNNTNLDSSAYLHTYKHFSNATEGALACQSECDSDEHCTGYTYVVPNTGHGDERCCHHADLGCPVPSVGCVSGSKIPLPCDPSGGDVSILKLELSLPVSSNF